MSFPVMNIVNGFLDKSEWIYCKSLLYRITGVVAIYFIIRIIFLIVNWDSFHTYYINITFKNVWQVILFGLYFDFVALLFLNFPIILLHLLPLKIRRYTFYKNLQVFLFVTVNAIAIFISIADIFYYKQSMERSSGAIIGMLDGFFLLIHQYSVDYWYAWIIFFIFFFILLFLYQKTKIHKYNEGRFLNQSFIFLSIIVLSSFMVLGAKAPIPPKISPLATNTPFIIINSCLRDPMFFNNKRLPNKSYFDEHELKKILTYRKNYFDPKKETHTANIIVIVLESFSKKYIGSLNLDSNIEEHSYTPFLDSLAQHSLVFTNAYANGKHSNEGIPAIFASVPYLMRESFITSMYKNNDINGIGDLFRKYGYNSAFFHGGTNGIYGFDFFAKKSGFEKYYGKDEYGNEKDYDGAWGIWDDKFFLFTAKEISKLKKPFIAGLFSVSSHHPFKLPDYYKDPREYPHPMLRCVGYTDYSLKNFFKMVSKESWFKNTLFVITADHTANINYPPVEERSINSKYHIPLLFYKPDNSLKGINKIIVQQIDIIPSIIDMLNVNIPYTGFGNSFMDKESKRFIYHYDNGIYQISDKNYLFNFDGQDIISCYDLQASGNNEKVIISKEEEMKKLIVPYENYLKATIQQYNNAMNNNTLAH